jgi:hypothetical protein
VDNIDKCQILLFFATENSIKSNRCAFELEIARNNNISVIPCLNNKISWLKLNQLKDGKYVFKNREFDLSRLDLDRKIGISLGDSFANVIKDITKEIEKTLAPFEKIFQFVNEVTILNINLLQKQLDIIKDEIEDIINILLKSKKIIGTWTFDKNYFFNKNNILIKSKHREKQGNFDKYQVLLRSIGIDKELIFIVLVSIVIFFIWDNVIIVLFVFPLIQFPTQDPFLLTFVQIYIQNNVITRLG